MNTQAYESIAQFCVEQHLKFDPAAWRRRGVADRKLVAVAAKYLSMTSWYGYEDKLAALSVDIDASVTDDAEFNRELGAIGLDLALFSAAVRCGIASRKSPPPAIPRKPVLAQRPLMAA